MNCQDKEREKHFGSKSELSRYVDKIKIRKSEDVVVQMKCTGKDPAMPEDDCGAATVRAKGAKCTSIDLRLGRRA